jgi:SAM-dependent methyltransferase
MNAALAAGNAAEAIPSLASIRKTNNDRLLALLAEVRGPDVLHVGCVNHQLPETVWGLRNHLHYQLCAAYPDLHILGLDLEPKGIAQLRERGFEVVEGDAHRMPFEAQFDTVLAGELIEHLNNPGLFLECCARALKPGGRLVLSTPNVFAPMFALMYAKNYDRAFNVEHTQWFCPQTLKELLRRYGFEIRQQMIVDDLCPEFVSSIPYKVFGYTWKVVRTFLPKRFRNTMVVVCEVAKR